MCGLFGQMSTIGLLEQSQFDRLLLLSKQRGPDASGYWSDQTRVQIGFNRLAILDESDRGNQPMISPSGRFVYVVNGEIYSFRALFDSLGVAPENRNSGSDAEVIGFLLDRFSVAETCSRLSGMFGLAIYDRRDQRLILARDRAGIKPLFYGRTKTVVVFASQFDQVFSFPGLDDHTIHPAGFRAYVQFGYMPAPSTVFENIHQVEPGELVVFNANLEKVNTRFFSLTHDPPAGSGTDDDLPRFLSTIKTAVKRQAVADVPLATFLSGGVDSPIITAALVHSGNPAHAFTVTNRDPAYDESDRAARYATSLGVSHTQAEFTETGLQETINRHFEAFPEPFGDSSSLPTYFIAEKAREKYTVMLSGDGGDELFWGYPRMWRVLEHVGFFQYPSAVRRPAAWLSRNLLRRDVSYAVDLIPDLGMWVQEIQSGIDPKKLDIWMKNVDLPPELVDLYRHPTGGWEAVAHWLRWNEFYGHLQRVLVKVDRASMAHGLEVRVPFLDDEVIDFAWRRRISGRRVESTTKKLLRDTLRSFYPDVVPDRSKKGFAVPVERWLHTTLREEVRDLVSGPSVFGGDFLSPAGVENYLDEFYTQADVSGRGLWALFAVQKWADRYNLR